MNRIFIEGESFLVKEDYIENVSGLQDKINSVVVLARMMGYTFSITKSRRNGYCGVLGDEDRYGIYVTFRSEYKSFQLVMNLLGEFLYAVDCKYYFELKVFGGKTERFTLDKEDMVDLPRTLDELIEYL